MSRAEVRGRARWLLAEVVVVILGVLIALWVDGVRQNRSDRATEQFWLRSLLSEAQEDRRQFEFTLSLYERRYQAQEELIQLEGRLSTVTTDSLDALWSQALSPGVTGFADAALTSTLSSGGMGLIADEELRLMLGEWPSTRSAFLGWEAEYNRTLAASLMPSLRSRHALPSALGSAPMNGASDPQALGRALTDPEVVQSLRQLSSFWWYFDEIFATNRRDFLQRLEARIAEHIHP